MPHRQAYFPHNHLTKPMGIQPTPQPTVQQVEHTATGRLLVASAHLHQQTHFPQPCHPPDTGPRSHTDLNKAQEI